mgnify:CR=1 FL=1
MPRIWTDEEREKQAEVARRHRIWEHSTGPKSNGGKAASSQNALKHGLRSQQGKELEQLLDEQADILAKIREREL